MKSQKIKGALYGTALGDARGAITEFSTFQQIKDEFDNQLDSFISQKSFLDKGGILGTVTDDFGSSYYIMKTLLETRGTFDKQIANTMIEKWSEDAYYFKFAGPTTKRMVEYIKKGLPKESEPGVSTNFISQGTNGAAMKVIPLAILAKKDIDKAIQYAIDISYPTHYNSLAVAGACAICASATQAQKEDASLDSILEAGLYGARIAKEHMDKVGRISIGPSLEYRIKEAIKIGRSCNRYEELLYAVDQKVGTNMDVNESIAAVYAIMAGVHGDCMKGIKVAVNVGGDTDTMAALIGGILGGYQGIEALPNDDIEFVIKQNPDMDIERVVDDFVQFIVHDKK